MPLTYSPHVPDNLLDAFEGTEVCRAMRDTFAKAPDTQWVVECAREHLGWRYFWLFRYPDTKRANAPDKHLHLTLNPDSSESAVSIDFAQDGPHRVTVRDRPAREERTDASHATS